MNSLHSFRAAPARFTRTSKLTHCLASRVIAQRHGGNDDHAGLPAYGRHDLWPSANFDLVLESVSRLEALLNAAGELPRS